MVGQLQNLQLLRAVAALTVVGHHAFDQLPALKTRFADVPIGDIGVYLFFVISGFVIYLSAAKPDVTAARFIRDRLVRVVPLYWLCTIALAALVVLLPDLSRSTAVSADTFLKSLFFIPHFSESHPASIWPLLVPGWSLNYEIFFYGLCALGLLIARGRTLVFLSCGLGALVVAGAIVEPKSAAAQVYTNSVLLYFLGGVALGAMYKRDLFALLPDLTALVPTGILFLAMSLWLEAPIGSAVVAILGASAVVAGMVGAEVRGRIVCGRLGRLLGDASYSIYLTHIFTLGLVRVAWSKLGLPAETGLDAALFLGAALIISAIVGVVVFWLVEKPMLSGLRRLAGPPSKGGPASNDGSVSREFRRLSLWLQPR
ncbi:MAG: acyltransferase [Pseudomonadota bacterium]